MLPLGGEHECDVASGEAQGVEAPRFHAAVVRADDLQFGSQITAFALPLIAALALHATPAQMGGLIAIESVPFLFLSFVAGVWVDRLRQTLVPVMLQGRMNAMMRFIGMGVIPLGALVGGALGERIGLADRRWCSDRSG